MIDLSTNVGLVRLVMHATPPDLVEALERSGLSEFFAGCTDSHRREYLNWILEAKRPETRRTRIEKAVSLLAEKQESERQRQRNKSHR